MQGLLQFCCTSRTKEDATHFGEKELNEKNPTLINMFCAIKETEQELMYMASFTSLQKLIIDL